MKIKLKNKIKTSGKQNSLPVFRLDNKLKWSSLTKTLINGSMIGVDPNHCSRFLEKFTLDVETSKNNQKEEDEERDDIKCTDNNKNIHHKLTSSKPSLVKRNTLVSNFLKQSLVQNNSELLAVLKSKKSRVSSFQTSNSYFRPDQLIFLNEGQQSQETRAKMVEVQVNSGKIKAGLNRNLSRRASSIPRTMNGDYKNRYFNDLFGETSPQNSSLNQKKIQTDNLTQKELIPIFNEYMLFKKNIPINRSLKRSHSSVTCRYSKNLKEKKSSKSERLNYSNDSQNLLYQDWVSKQFQKIKNKSGKIEEFLELEVPWYCNRRITKFKMRYLCPIVLTICSKKHILKKQEVTVNWKQNSHPKAMSKKELTSMVIRRRINSRRTNLHQSSLLNIIDFEVFEEIIEYSTNRSSIEIEEIRSDPKNISKNTKSQIQNALIQSQLHFPEEVSEKRKISPNKRDTKVFTNMVRVVKSNTHQLKKEGRSSAIKIKRAFLKIFNYFMLSKVKGHHFKNVVNNFFQRLQLNNLDSSLASLEGYQRQKMVELNYNNYLIRHSILMINAGENLMYSRQVTLRQDIRQRIIQIIRYKNNMEEVQKVITKSKQVNSL